MTRPRSLRRAALAAVVCLTALAGCGGHVMPQIHTEADRLAAARRLHDSEDYGDAIELLKTYTTNAAGTADVDQAIYLLGDCYLKNRDWAPAAEEFERLGRDYPESDSSGAAAFRLGEAYFGQSRGEDFDQEFTHKALDQWQSYLRLNPGHWLNAAAEAKVLMARTRLAHKLVSTGHLYLKLRLWEPARFYFKKVNDEYGDTPARAEAELGLAMADAHEKKKDEAIVQLKDIESRYPGTEVAERAARERKRLEGG